MIVGAALGLAALMAAFIFAVAAGLTTVAALAVFAIPKLRGSSIVTKAVYSLLASIAVLLVASASLALIWVAGTYLGRVPTNVVIMLVLIAPAATLWLSLMRTARAAKLAKWLRITACLIGAIVTHVGMIYSIAWALEATHG